MEAVLNFKGALIRALDGNSLALVIIAAVAVQFGVALVARRRLAHWLPWAAALVAVAGNELVSAIADRVIAPGEEWLALRDIAIGMLIPTALTLAVRYYPIVFTPASAKILKQDRFYRADRKGKIVDADFEEIS